MILGINTCNCERRNANDIIELFTKIAIKYPAHNFIFFTDKTGEQETATTKNCTTITVKPRPQNKLLWQFWYKTQIDAIAKKQQIELFINADILFYLRSK